VGRRIGAVIFDALLLIPVALAVDGLLGVKLPQAGAARHALPPHDRRILLEFSIAVSVAYYATLLAVWNGQTVGKRLFRVRVVRADGLPVSFARATWRETGVRLVIIGGLAGLPGPLWAAYGLAGTVADLFCLLAHPEHRALHDLLAGTRVIVADRPPPSGLA
jgi:uncharacterized RDD family membrane protein YckC